LFFSVKPVVPPVVVVLPRFTFLSLCKFIFFTVWTFITDTLVRDTTVIENFFDLLSITVLTVWIKFTGKVLIPVLQVTWSFIVTSFLDASVFWTANVSRSSSHPRVVTVITPSSSWSKVFVFSTNWKIWARISFIITTPNVTFKTSTRFTVSFLVDIANVESKSVFPPSVADLSSTYADTIWNTFQQDFAAFVIVITVNWSESFFAFTWFVTEFSVTFTVEFSADTVWITSGWVLDKFLN
jgi:hypothetical protein